MQCELCPKWPQKMRERRGCDGPTPDPLFEYAGEDYYECPGKVVTQASSSFLNLYALGLKFKKFPLAGGLYDQTEIFIQVAGTVQSIINEVEVEKMDKKRMSSENRITTAKPRGSN